MEKFIIGGKDHDAIVTYRVRRYFTENCTSEKLKSMTFEQSEDIVLDAILMCLVDRSVFKDRDALMDILTNDEYRTLDARFQKILNPDAEGKSEIEKKPESTTTL